LLNGKTIRHAQVFRERVIRPTPLKSLCRKLSGAKFIELERRGKYLVFSLEAANGGDFKVMGHLGMTGRMYLLPEQAKLPKHASVVLDLGPECFVFEDTRYFGRWTLDMSPIERLGPEPLSSGFDSEYLHDALQRSSQPIKVKLLDQRLVAGVGNIYASEALFRARISPRTAARRLKRSQIHQLWKSVREVLNEAIRFGSTVPLNYGAKGDGDKLFYFGQAADASEFSTERLLVYDRLKQPCKRCGKTIKRITQAGRSTFFCPQCQHRKAAT